MLWSLVRIDEAYIKAHGQWTYLCRAVDKEGQTINFRLSRRPDIATAKAFFEKAIRYEDRPPHTITVAGCAASLTEQNHRGITFRTRSMLGFTNFRSAQFPSLAFELLHRIHTDHFDLDFVFAANAGALSEPICLIQTA